MGPGYDLVDIVVDAEMRDFSLQLLLEPGSFVAHADPG